MRDAIGVLEDSVSDVVYELKELRELKDELERKIEGLENEIDNLNRLVKDQDREIGATIAQLE